MLRGDESQASLARRAGLHPSTVCAIERGRLVPYDAQAKKLAAALGWEGDPSALFEEVDTCER